MKKLLIFILSLIVIESIFSVNSNSFISKTQNNRESERKSKTELNEKQETNEVPEHRIIDTSLLTNGHFNVDYRILPKEIPKDFKTGMLYPNCDKDTEDFITVCLCIAPNSRIEGSKCKVGSLHANKNTAERVDSSSDEMNQNSEADKSQKVPLVPCQSTTKKFRAKCSCVLGKISDDNCVFQNDPLKEGDSQELNEYYNQVYESQQTALYAGKMYKKLHDNSGFQVPNIPNRLPPVPNTESNLP